jgi:hypothetical protein
MIFNASTKVNQEVYDHFNELGLNVKKFDSVNRSEINPNTEKPYTRTEIVDWFKNTPNAILINVNVFTTGFNVTDVECIIVNRATKSLSLWLQMVGRGSRTTDKIYKDVFTVIDLGYNIREHLRWSEKRDWKRWFYPSIPKLKRIMDLTDTWECSGCKNLNVIGDLYCTNCGLEKPTREASEKSGRDGILIEHESMPLPNSKSIIEYTIKQGETANFAFKILTNRILELFTHHNITLKQYQEQEERFNNRINQIVRPIYFAIIKSDLKGSNKRLKTYTSKLLTRLSNFL